MDAARTPTRRDRARRRNRVWWAAHKKTLFCVACGETRPACLDYHHRSRSQKRSSVSRMVGDGYSLAAIQAEIAKCSCFCANCHRIFERAAHR